jgi:hypothetical protein
VGGATGLLSMEVAKKQAHLQCISFDLPPVEPIAEKKITAADLENRIICHCPKAIQPVHRLELSGITNISDMAAKPVA